MPRPLEPTVTVEIILEEGRDDAVPADVVGYNHKFSCDRTLTKVARSDKRSLNG